MIGLLWRQGASLALVTASFLQIHSVQAININYCSTENTGGDSLPNSYSLQSLGHCREQCSGFAFAITQDKDCWCSNYAPGSTIDDSSCNLQCPGYPYEVCGSSFGAYSYIQIGTPSGTQGASVDSSSDTPDTVYKTVEATIVSNNVVTTAIVQTSVYFASASSVEPETITQVRTVPVTQKPVTRVQTSLVAVTQHPKSASLEVVTVSGAIQTRYITGAPSGSSQNVKAANQGLSNGAVAGITVGAIIAAVIAGLLIFFCCWRKRNTEEAPAPGINRNTSVLSKVGLLRHASTRPGNAAPEEVAGMGVSSSAPRLDTDIPSFAASGPPSTTASGTMLERRDSRPLFRDQRLNPNVVMLHNDTSRTSIGTLQDDKDYSRPLEVRNP